MRAGGNESGARTQLKSASSASSALALLLSLIGPSLAQDASPGKLLLEAAADGVQIYSCQPKEQGFAWVFVAPEAALFNAGGRQIGTHSKGLTSKGPTWTLADGSSVVGELVSKQPAPQPGSIPWLSLRAISHQGSGALAGVATIRRIDTKGGVEPAEGCDSAHIGEVARMRYSATYQFFGS